jgi:cytidylate kinase
MSEMYESSQVAQMVEREWNKWFLLTKKKQDAQSATIFPTVTISREKSSGGRSIARAIAERLHYVVFDRELVDAVARSAAVDRLVVEHLDEHSRRSIQEWTDRVLHRQSFSPETYLAHLTKTISTIGNQGRAVIVGRGAHLLLPLERCFRVRVVAPADIRARRLILSAGLEGAVAERMIAEEDRQRAQFILENFRQSDANPLLYDLVINTDRVSAETAADLIVRALEARFPGATTAPTSQHAVSRSS